MGALLAILFYGVVGAVVVAAGVVFYLRAAASRKQYCCPQCGERFGVELMKASHCNVCGTPVRHPMNQRGGV